MKTKIVYVLVSSPDDCFYEQLLMSLYSLRLYNKDAFVELVVDSGTNLNLTGFRGQINNLVEKKSVVDVPLTYTQKEKSRYIKTNLRRLVVGDYLFIDTDTIICDNLSEVDSFTENIYATSNGNTSLEVSNTVDFDYMLAMAKIMEYDLIGCEYHNSGVFFVKDNESTQSFYRDWYEYYKKCTERGVDMDQISLCKVNALHHNFISHMPEEWNCQIQRRGLLLTGKKKIIHYYTNINPSHFILAEREIHEKIKKQEYLSEDVIDFLNKPGTAFGKGRSVLVGDDVDLVNSQLFKFMRKHPVIFKLFNHILK